MLPIGVVELFKAAEKGGPIKGQRFACQYNAGAKSFVLCLEAHSSKFSLPAVEKPLSLICPYLTLQVFILPGKPFCLELSVTDSSNTRRRVVFSSAAKSTTISLMHARTVESFPRNVWTNLCIDIVAHLRAFFPAATFRSVEEITVCSFCRVRRVFGTKLPLVGTEAGALPKSFEFNPGVEVVTVLIVPTGAEAPKPPAPKHPKHSTATTDKLRELRTASPQTVARVVSSCSPAPRPQKSAPPHRVLPPKPLPRTQKPALRGTFTTLSSQKPQGKPQQKRAATLSAEDNDALRLTAYSKFDSAATNLDDASSVQEEIEEEVKAGERTLAPHAQEEEIREEIDTLRKRGEGDFSREKYFEQRVDLLTNARPYSPPFLGLTDRSCDKEMVKVSAPSEPLVELIHDPVLHCYYDPATQEYFELAN